MKKKWKISYISQLKLADVCELHNNVVHSVCQANAIYIDFEEANITW